MQAIEIGTAQPKRQMRGKEEGVREGVTKRGKRERGREGVCGAEERRISEILCMLLLDA